MPRSTRRHIALGLIALVALFAGSLIASDALARRAVKLPNMWREVQQRLAELLTRVDAIEEADCGCPGLLEPVCADGRTYVNLCEARCALARLGAELDRFTALHGGPCEASFPLCGDSACTAGHICIDGECVVDRCIGFSGGVGSDACPCPRGFRCAVPPEVCGSHCICDAESGTSVCTQTCSPMCVPDTATAAPPRQTELP